MKILRCIIAVIFCVGAVGFASCKNEELACEHVWLAWEELLPATCLSNGKEIRYCAGDQTHFEERDIPATGHMVEEWFAVGDGHVGFCSECGGETEVKEHEFENGVCILCGEEEF